MRPAPWRPGSMCTTAPSASARSFSRRAVSASYARLALATRRALGRIQQAVHEALGFAHRQRAVDDARRGAGLLRRSAARATRAHGPCRARRRAGIPARASRARSGAAGSTRRCASGRPPSPRRRASGRTRRSGAAALAPPRADSGPRAGCSRSARRASAAWSGTFFTSAGISRKPACCAARQRRSPAMISKRPPSTGRTRIGCITPCSLDR